MTKEITTFEMIGEVFNFYINDREVSPYFFLNELENLEKGKNFIMIKAKNGKVIWEIEK